MNIFEGMPDTLKDPRKYEDIVNSIDSLVKTDHKHKLVSEYVQCADCQAKYRARNDRIMELGFAGPLQYLEWKRVMAIMRQKRFKIIYEKDNKIRRGKRGKANAKTTRTKAKKRSKVTK